MAYIMAFTLFTFLIVFAIGFMGTLSLAQTNHTLYGGIAASLLIAILCVTISPAFATLIGVAIILGGWKKEGLNQKKHKHLDWGKLDKSNMLVVKDKISEGAIEAFQSTIEGDVEIVQSAETEDDFRDRALTQNPFRKTSLKTR